jgi:hypothetical protein
MVIAASIPEPASRFDDLRRFDVELERVRVLAERAAGLSDESDRLASLEANLAKSAGTRIHNIKRRFGLGPDELSFMWTVVAAGYDPRTAHALERIGGADTRGGATIAMHAVIHGLDAVRARTLVRTLSATHPLFATSLLVTRDHAADAPAVRVWRAAERFARFLAGVDDVDPTLASVGGYLRPAANVVTSPAQAATLELLEQLLRSASTVLLEGPDGVGRRTLATIAAQSIGRPVVHVDLSRRHLSLASFEALTAALVREVTLVPDVIVLIANLDDLIEPGDHASASLRMLANTIERLDAPVVLTSSTPGMMLPITKLPVRLRIAAPDHEHRLRLWQQALAGETAALAASLPDIALRYRVGPGAITTAASSS